MTMVSLLAITVLFGWRIAASAWQKANTHLEGYRTVIETHHLIEQQMSSMVFYRAQSKTLGTPIFFQGDPVTARFISRYSLMGRATSGLYRIEYQIVEATDQTKQLWMNEFPVTNREDLGLLLREPDPASTVRIPRFVPFESGPQTRMLLEGLKDCRFEYYKPPKPPEPGSWSNQWLNQSDELPSAMAVRIAPSSDSGDLQPASVVAAIRSVISIIPVQED